MDRTGLGDVPPVARDHGGGIDAACSRWGGTRGEWLDLSTGINPVPYPLPTVPAAAWTALPDRTAHDRLVAAARRFWSVPDRLDILPTHGASAAIARLPSLAGVTGDAHIPQPTYNEHEAAFRAAGWTVIHEKPARSAAATVLVHPNNPDGRLWDERALPETGLLVIDESFCDVAPDQSLLPQIADRPDTVVLKSFGKFWGLAGLRLGFVIGSPRLVDALRDMTGPWSVSGPALAIGAIALDDDAWAQQTRARLARDAMRLDELVAAKGILPVGGTPLFRLYETNDAAAFQSRLANHQIWSRVFPYSNHWVRLGLLGKHADWGRLEAALA